MNSTNSKIPNIRLRSERELRGWSQSKVAKEIGTNTDRISRWECGESAVSPYYREKLCALFSKNAEELGFLNDATGDSSPVTTSAHLPNDTLSEQSSTSVLLDTAAYNGLYPQQGTTLPGERGESLAVRGVPMVLIPTHQVVDILRNASDAISEQQLGALLAYEANELTAFFDEGWSVDELLESLRVLLQGVQMMSKITRRKVFQLGVAAALGGISVPSGRHISVEDRVKLHDALGKSIAAGWKLFHTAGNAQVLAVGQAQIHLIRQASSQLYPSVRPLLYSSAYNLVGAARHFQGRYDEAYQVHEQGYVAALEGMDMLSMAQSRTWQANGLREQQRYSEALETIEAALRLISLQSDTESIRLRAHLFASGAEMAAFLGETELVRKNLGASEELLERLPLIPTEEFDHASWHQYAGTCALILKQYDQAVRELQLAIDALPPQWLVRQSTALMPLAIAYARKRERDRCFELAEKAHRVIREMNAPSLNRQFVKYLKEEIQVAFPDDSHIGAFITEVQQQLTSTSASIG